MGARSWLNSIGGNGRERWVNSGTKRRRSYIDVVGVKSGIGCDESDKVRLLMICGWPKEREKRLGLVDRVGEHDLEDERLGNFGLTGVPVEIDGDLTIGRMG